MSVHPAWRDCRCLDGGRVVVPGGRLGRCCCRHSPLRCCCRRHRVAVAVVADCHSAVVVSVGRGRGAAVPDATAVLPHRWSAVARCAPADAIASEPRPLLVAVAEPPLMPIRRGYTDARSRTRIWLSAVRDRRSVVAATQHGRCPGATASAPTRPMCLAYPTGGSSPLTRVFRGRRFRRVVPLLFDVYPRSLGWTVRPSDTGRIGCFPILRAAPPTICPESGTRRTPLRCCGDSPQCQGVVVACRVLSGVSALLLRQERRRRRRPRR